MSSADSKNRDSVTFCPIYDEDFPPVTVKVKGGQVIKIGDFVIKGNWANINPTGKNNSVNLIQNKRKVFRAILIDIERDGAQSLFNHPLHLRAKTRRASNTNNFLFTHTFIILTLKCLIIHSNI